MDQLLKQDMENLKVQVGDIGGKVNEMSEIVKEMSFALTGNKFTKDGGIVNEHIKLKAEVAILRNRVEILEKEKETRAGKDKILWTIVGAVGLAVLYFIKDFIVRLISK